MAEKLLQSPVILLRLLQGQHVARASHYLQAGAFDLLVQVLAVEFVETGAGQVQFAGGLAGGAFLAAVSGQAMADERRPILR